MDTRVSSQYSPLPPYTKPVRDGNASPCKSRYIFGLLRAVAARQTTRGPYESKVGHENGFRLESSKIPSHSRSGQIAARRMIDIQDALPRLPVAVHHRATGEGWMNPLQLFTKSFNQGLHTDYKLTSPRSAVPRYSCGGNYIH